MTAVEYVKLAESIAKEYEGQEKRYNQRLAWLIIKGYLILSTNWLLVFGGCILAICTVSFTEGLSWRFIITAIVVVGSILSFVWLGVVMHSLFAKIEVPSGLLLDEQRFPQIFEMIRGIERELDTPRIDRVVVTEEVNASMFQCPQWFGLKRSNNVLSIGLPLLFFLSPDEFKAVLRHELAHLSSKHSQFVIWLIKIRNSWQRLDSSLTLKTNEQGNVHSGRKAEFLAYFSAFTLSQSKAFEYAADRLACEHSEPRIYLNAFLKIEIALRYVGREFKINIERKMISSETPRVAPFAELRFELRRLFSDERSSQYYELAKNRAQSIVFESHPTLVEKASFLGLELQKPGPINEENLAGEVLLGEQLFELLAELNLKWRERIKEQWTYVYKQGQKNFIWLRDYEKNRGKKGEVKIDDEIRRAHVLNQFDNSGQSSINAFEELFETFPENDAVAFEAGLRFLLPSENEKCRERGAGILNEVAKLDSSFSKNACEQLAIYYAMKGESDLSRRYEMQVYEELDKIEEANIERTRITLQDEFIAHDMPTDELTSLLRFFSKYKAIGRVYLVQKKISKFSDTRMYVIGFKFRALSIHSGELSNTVSNKALEEFKLNGSFFIMCLNGPWARFEKIFKRTKHARIV